MTGAVMAASPAIILFSGSESLASSSDLDELEVSGSFARARQLLRDSLRSGQVGVPHEQALHRLGRLYQRLNSNQEAERAYRLALRLNPALPPPQQSRGLTHGCVGLPVSRPLALGRAGFVWDSGV